MATDTVGVAASVCVAILTTGVEEADGKGADCVVAEGVATGGEGVTPLSQAARESRPSAIMAPASLWCLTGVFMSYIYIGCLQQYGSISTLQGGIRGKVWRGKT
jgi:hypothetical protein